jgi:hypothetical protein
VRVGGYPFPEIGAKHKCMIFLTQDGTEGAWSLAEEECANYGFKHTWDMTFGLLQIEVLNTDAYRGFAGFYEEALRDGSSLVYYPNP